MHIVKTSYFTLLELLVVLFIISFGVVLTGVKIKDIYQEQRFLSDAQQVLSHLAMAQDMMLIMDTDVQVRIAADKQTKDFKIWLEIEKPVEKSWAPLIERKLHLSAIQSLKFEGSFTKDLTLQFSLGQMSKGTLVLLEGEQTSKNQLKQREFDIELLGYPSPIGVKSKPLNEDKKIEQSELLYPIEVYEKLYRDPNEKQTSPLS